MSEFRYQLKKGHEQQAAEKTAKDYAAAQAKLTGQPHEIKHYDDYNDTSVSGRYVVSKRGKPPYGYGR